MNTLTMRPLADADIGLMALWLNKDYILKWYLDADDWLHEMNERNDSFSWIHHFIVMDDLTPIGFCQYYDCYDAKDLEDWYTVTQRSKTYSIDYLIGDERYLGKGYGKTIVGLLSATLRAKEGPCEIIVQPDRENHASNNVLLANGYLYDEPLGYYYKVFP